MTDERLRVTSARSVRKDPSSNLSRLLMWIHTGKSCRKSCRILAPTSKLGATRSAEFFFFFITLGLELSDTKVYEP